MDQEPAVIAFLWQQAFLSHPGPQWHQLSSARLPSGIEFSKVCRQYRRRLSGRLWHMSEGKMNIASSEPVSGEFKFGD